jgi:hypothetical protein
MHVFGYCFVTESHIHSQHNNNTKREQRTSNTRPNNRQQVAKFSKHSVAILLELLHSNKVADSQ